MTLERYCKQYKNELTAKMRKYAALRDLDIFVLDNSIRESTVGQLRGHTSTDKWKIYDEVKKCGFSNAIVASFSDDMNVDDDFLQEVVLNEEDRGGLFAFSEITTSVTNGVPDCQRLPLGLEKLKRLRMRNVILEVDLGDSKYDFNKISIDKLCQLLLNLITWCHDNLFENCKVLVNFRDMPDAMATEPKRVFSVVEYLAKLEPRLCPFGILFEDPRGGSLPEQFATWARFVRQIMDDYNWKGHLLVHVHEKFCLADNIVLEALINGANGIWAGVCQEGAPVGHASSIVTLTNLARLGNQHVNRRYNCSYLRTAAANITQITTGHQAPIKQPIYGERALDLVLNLRKDEFDLAAFFGESAPARISSVCNVGMIQRRLVDMFGPDEQFTLNMADKMKKQLFKDLREYRKEEYMSIYGLAILFCRSGGVLSPEMRRLLKANSLSSAHAQIMMKKIRKRWTSGCSQFKNSMEDRLPYNVFYSSFMQPYFADYRCLDTRKTLKLLDPEANKYVDWKEFQIYLTWALQQYPETVCVDEVLDIVFGKGLQPIIRVECLKPSRTDSRTNKENRLTDRSSKEQLKLRSKDTLKRSDKRPFLPKINI